MLGLSREDLEAMNLQQLRSRDTAIEQVLGQAGHVSLYDFDCGTASWRKKGVEGPLFVVKRGAYPRFQFVILNRLGTDCLVQDVLSDFDLELNEPYLLYKNSEGEVQGIWFYKARECAEVVALIQKLRRTYAGAGASEAPERPDVAATPPPKAAKGGQKAKKVKKPAMETPQRILQRPGSGEDADSAEFEIPTAVLDKKAANKEVKPAKKS